MKKWLPIFLIILLFILSACKGSEPEQIKSLTKKELIKINKTIILKAESSYNPKSEQPYEIAYHVEIPKESPFYEKGKLYIWTYPVWDLEPSNYKSMLEINPTFEIWDKTEDGYYSLEYPKEKEASYFDERYSLEEVMAGKEKIVFLDTDKQFQKNTIIRYGDEERFHPSKWVPNTIMHDFKKNKQYQAVLEYIKSIKNNKKN